MANKSTSNGRVTKWVRRIARIWSIAVMAITLVIVVGHAVNPDPNEVDYPASENLMPLSLVLSVVGLGIAWRREGLGGAINVVFFAANLVLYRVLHGEFLQWGVVAALSPVIIPGILFLGCWWRSRE
jgi:hypothetical protein